MKHVQLKDFQLLLIRQITSPMKSVMTEKQSQRDLVAQYIHILFLLRHSLQDACTANVDTVHVIRRNMRFDEVDAQIDLLLQLCLYISRQAGDTILGGGSRPIWTGNLCRNASRRRQAIRWAVFLGKSTTQTNKRSLIE